MSRRHKDRTIYARNCGQGSCQRKERLQISPTSIERGKEKYDRRNLRLQHGSKKGSRKGDGKSSNQICNLQKKKKKKVLQLARMGMPQYSAHHFQSLGKIAHGKQKLSMNISMNVEGQQLEQIISYTSCGRISEWHISWHTYTHSQSHCLRSMYLHVQYQQMRDYIQRKGILAFQIRKTHMQYTQELDTTIPLVV